MYWFAGEKHTAKASWERKQRLKNSNPKFLEKFKSLENLHIFAVLSSVIDTLLKQNQPIFESLDCSVSFRPE